MTASALIDGKTRKLAVKEFRVKPLPEPNGCLKTPSGSFFGGKIKKAHLMQATVGAEFKDPDFGVRYNVLGFSLKSIGPNGKMETQITSCSNTLTEVMKNKIKTLTSGDVCLFSDITVVGPDKIKHKLPTVECVIQ